MIAAVHPPLPVWWTLAALIAANAGGVLVHELVRRWRHRH